MSRCGRERSDESDGGDVGDDSQNVPMEMGSRASAVMVMVMVMVMVIGGRWSVIGTVISSSRGLLKRSMETAAM